MAVAVKTIKIIYWLLIAFFIVLIIVNTVPYYLFDPNLLREYALSGKYPFLVSKQNLVYSLLWRVAFYMHITGAMACIVSGFPQFSFWLLRKKRNLHRWLGKIYIVSVLYIACPSGFYMSFFTNGGIMGIIPFMSIAVLWFFTSYTAYRYIKNKNITEHGLWMVRSYALTLSAITFRIYNYIFGIFLDMHPIQNYILSLWISLLGNILIGEIAVLYYKNRIFKTQNFLIDENK